VNNKSQIYNSVDFCVVPSIEPEPFGLTVIEPADFEKMTIASNIGAIGEIVEDNITGLLFDPQNVNTLIDRLDFIMNKPEFIKEMGKNAKNRYKLKFSNSKMNEEIKKTLVTKIENSNAKS
jgi:glycosyltransferase involved in cell wall biosynthesis